MLLHRPRRRRALLLATIQTGDMLTFIFGSFLLIFGYFLRTRLTSGDESNIPKCLKHERTKKHRSSTYGNPIRSTTRRCRHDPFNPAPT